MLFTHVTQVEVVLLDACFAAGAWTAGEGRGESGKVEEGKVAAVDGGERRSCWMKVEEEGRMTQITGVGMK